jgi:hypothetical protein
MASARIFYSVEKGFTIERDERKEKTIPAEPEKERPELGREAGERDERSSSRRAADK